MGSFYVRAEGSSLPGLLTGGWATFTCRRVQDSELLSHSLLSIHITAVDQGSRSCCSISLSFLI